MARTGKPPLVHLDTHVVLWLHDGLTDKLSARAVELIEAGSLRFSPIVELEIQYLREIGRVAGSVEGILSALEREIGLKRSDIPFAEVVEHARSLPWTRDPFDRLIVGEVLAAGALLVTSDATIRKHVKKAQW